MDLPRRAVLGMIAAIPVVGTDLTAVDSSSGAGYGEAIYGEGGYGGMPANCFIATAACGTESHEDVITLRHFRDDVLLQNRLGRLTVKTYYALSPPFAHWISRSPRRQATVRRMIVKPASRLTAAVTHD